MGHQATSLVNKVYFEAKAALIRNRMKGKKLLVAVSGGQDSMVLLDVLNRLSVSFKIELSVAHVHHGPIGKKTQAQFRSRALQFVGSQSKKLMLPFYFQRSSRILKSELEMREFRHQALRKIAEHEKFDAVIFAHHADDLLETRLMRMIRGTGAQGLEAMEEFQNLVFRPFLRVDLDAIAAYARDRKLKFLNDPSNKDLKYFRNWIRRAWIPMLEKRSPGSKKSLARSLEQLLVTNAAVDSTGLVTEAGISRSGLMALTHRDQRRVVASYLHAKNVKNYSASQIDEVLKRLDSSKSKLSFKVAGCDWTVDTWHIRCEFT